MTVCDSLFLETLYLPTEAGWGRHPLELPPRSLFAAATGGGLGWKPRPHRASEAKPRTEGVRLRGASIKLLSIHLHISNIEPKRCLNCEIVANCIERGVQYNEL